MKEMNLNLYGLVKVWAPELSARVYQGFEALLGDFFVQEKPEFGCRDVPLLLLASSRIRAALENLHPTPYGISLVRYRGESGIALNYRGRPDMVLMLGNKIKIYFTPRRKNFRRLYGLTLFAINLVMHKKTGLLYHGAAAAKEERALLLTGLRGSKKTQLLLTLLRDGWEYIGDDKVLLHGGRMHLFQDFIPVNDHHLDNLPWLYERLPDRARWKKNPINRKVRSGLAALSRRYLNKHVLSAMKKVYDPEVMVKIRDIFPSCSIAERRRPSAVVILSLGDDVCCRRIASESALREISALQSLVFYQTGPLEQLAFLCNQNFELSVGEVVRENLSDRRFFRLSLPGTVDMDEACHALIERIEEHVA